MMKVIDVKQQPKLSFRRTMEICVNGVRYRLFRSAVTVVVIAVAIAFMMNIMCEAISMQAVARAARQRTAEQRLAALWTARLSMPATLETILQEVASAPAKSLTHAEARQFSGLSVAEYQAFRQRAPQAVRYLEFFSQLDYGRRRILVSGNAEGCRLFDSLQTPAAQQHFQTKLREMKTLRFVTSHEEFTRFLADWPTIKMHAERIQRGRDAGVARISKALGSRTLLEALGDAEGAFGDTVQAAGFLAFDAHIRPVVARQSRQLVQMQILEDSLEQPPIRAYVFARKNLNSQADVKPAVLWPLLRNRKEAALFLEKMQDAAVAIQITPEEVVQLAQRKAKEEALDSAMRLTAETGGGLLGIGSRMTWLMLVSLLVCAVGISNAMLMSVTERFREIATLKCLGALDEFIMSLFVTEACMLGLVGGLFGGLAGSLIGFGRMAGTFGGLLFSAFPVGSWGIALGFSLVIGIVLAALAGVYPSYMAARLAPMEAMRIE